MKVVIKKFDVDMEVKNRGVEFEIRSPDGTQHLGDVVLTKKHVIWCKGRTLSKNGQKVTWNRFIEMMERAKE